MRAGSGIQVINLVVREGAVSEFEMVTDGEDFEAGDEDEDAVF